MALPDKGPRQARRYPVGPRPPILGCEEDDDQGEEDDNHGCAKDEPFRQQRPVVRTLRSEMAL